MDNSRPMLRCHDSRPPSADALLTAIGTNHTQLVLQLSSMRDRVLALEGPPEVKDFANASVRDIIARAIHASRRHLAVLVGIDEELADLGREGASCGAV